MMVCEFIETCDVRVSESRYRNFCKVFNKINMFCKYRREGFFKSPREWYDSSIETIKEGEQ